MKPMKLARLIPLMMLAMLSAGAKAETASQNQFGENSEFTICQSFDECMIVWGGCADEAINKRYLNQFKESPVCTASSPHNPKAMPTCTNGKCVVVILDNKNGP